MLRGVGDLAGRGMRQHVTGKVRDRLSVAVEVVAERLAADAIWQKLRTAD